MYLVRLKSGSCCCWAWLLVPGLAHLLLVPGALGQVKSRLAVVHHRLWYAIAVGAPATGCKSSHGLAPPAVSVPKTTRLLYQFRHLILIVPPSSGGVKVCNLVLLNPASSTTRALGLYQMLPLLVAKLPGGIVQGIKLQAALHLGLRLALHLHLAGGFLGRRYQMKG